MLKYGEIFPASDLTVTVTPLLTLALSALMLGYVFEWKYWNELFLLCPLRYLISAFFTKANLATLCGILIYFISYLPFILVMFLETKMQLGHKLLIVSLVSTLHFSLHSFSLAFVELVQCDGIWLFVDLLDTFWIPGRRCAMEYSFQKHFPQWSNELRYCLCNDASRFDNLWFNR